MSFNHILIIFMLAMFTTGCTNDLRFSKGKNGGLESNPPGNCPASLGSFEAPPSLVELGQVLSLEYPGVDATWFIQKPDGQVDTLTGATAPYTVSQLGRHMGKVEGVNSCGTITVLNFIFDAFLPVGASTIIINSGEAYTINAEVSLSLASDGATEMYITEDATCASGGQWEVYNTQKLHTLQARNQNVNVYARFKNPVGNMSSCVSDSIIHDDIKPSLQIVAAPAAITNQTGAGFTMNASDSGSGVDIYFCSLDSANVNICSNQVNYSNMADGSHTFNVRVSDKAGNLSDWIQHTWLVDTVRPTLRFTGTPANPSAISAARFEFDGEDIGSGVDSYECKLDSGNYAPCTSPRSFNVTDGSHTYYVRNKDKAGNISDAISYTWITDASAPVIRITSAPLSPTTSKDAVIQFTVTDAVSGVDTIKCSLDGSTFTDCVNQVSYANLDIGSHRFTVVATDKVGHSSQAVHNWTIQHNVIDQPEVIPPGIGAADILFVMDTTVSMYGEYVDQVAFQMQDFVSRLSSNYQIGVVTSDARDSSSPYSGGQLVPLEDTSPSAYIMTAQTPNVQNVFLETLARKEVTCTPGTWSGPNGRFCGTNGWNLPTSSQLITSTVKAIQLNANQALFRSESPLHIIMVSDGNEVCSSNMYGNDGMCLSQDTDHRAESVIAAVNTKFPGKPLKVHSLIWRNADNCGPRGGEKKGTTYEYLSSLTGGVSRSICNVNASEGNAIASAISSGGGSYTATLQCNPVDINKDGVVDANDVVITYNPQPSQLPSVTLNGNKIQLSPAPAAGTQVNFRYTCP